MRAGRWALFERQVVMDRERPAVVHLDRLKLVDTPLGGLYLHHIRSDDAAPQPHDHSRWFASLLLRGGYVEELYEVTDPAAATPWELVSVTPRLPISIKATRTTTAHRVRRLEPGTTALVLVGRVTRERHFWTSSGMVPWSDYYRRG